MPTRINNQAVPLYAPGETLFNDKTSRCEWHENFSQLATCEDVTEIMVNIPLVRENVGTDSQFQFVKTGFLDGTSFTDVISIPGETFISSGVAKGMFFMNYVSGVNGTTNGGTIIQSVDSETQITLAANISFTHGDYFEISNWNYNGDIRTRFGYAEIDNLVPTTADSLIKQPIKNNAFYKVEFTIVFIDPDNPASSLSVYLGATTGTPVMELFADDIEGKTYTAFGFSNSNQFNLIVRGSSKINIGSIVISEMQHTTFEIRDFETGNSIYSSVDSDFIYSTSLNQTKMFVRWENVTTGYVCAGCYYIEVDQEPDPNDSIDRINDGSFSTCSPWVMNGDVACGGILRFRFDTISNTFASQTDLAANFELGYDYDITFDMVVNDLQASGVYITLYNNSVLIFTSDEIKATGTHVVSTGILPSNCNEIIIRSENEFDFEIDNVSAFATNVVDGFNYITNPFQLVEDLDCTVKLSGTNNDNAFGIDFIGLSYTPFIRVPGGLEAPKWTGDKENEEDSAGISKTLYFKSDTIRDLFLYQLPEYHHDFIRLLIGYDIFAVDDIEYISTDGSYTPESERVLGKLTDLNNSKTELRLATDLNVNKFC